MFLHEMENMIIKVARPKLHNSGWGPGRLYVRICLAKMCEVIQVKRICVDLVLPRLHAVAVATVLRPLLSEL